MQITIPEGFHFYHNGKRVRLTQSVTARAVYDPYIDKSQEEREKDNRQGFDEWCNKSYPNEHLRTAIVYGRFSDKGATHWVMPDGVNQGGITACGVILGGAYDGNYVTVEDVRECRMCKVCMIRNRPFTRQEYNENFFIDEGY